MVASSYGRMRSSGKMKRDGSFGRQTNPGEVPTDVGPQRRSRGIVDTLGQADRWLSARRLWKMILVSVLIHFILTPFPALLGMVAMLPALELSSREELIEIDLNAIPLSAIAEVPEEPASPEDSKEKAAEAEGSQAALPPDQEAEMEARPEKPTPPRKASDYRHEQESPPPSKTPGPTKEFGDPIALAGSAGEIADSNANVRLFLYTEVVRKHPLGERISGLLKRTPQWKDFFGPSKIDPISDIDRVMIAGPQLRSSAQVVAIVQHRLSQTRIEQAFDALVQRDGAWIDRKPLIARGKADRAFRIFAAPTPRLVVVSPPQLEAQVRGIKDGAAFAESAGDMAVSAYVITPHRALKGTGIRIPETLKWVRLDLRPLDDGGALLKVLAEDADAISARNDAEIIQALIVQATSIDFSRMGSLGGLASLAFGAKEKKWIKSVSFRSEGDKIHGTIEVTAEQLMTAVDLLEAFLPPDDDSVSATAATQGDPEATDSRPVEKKALPALGESSTEEETPAQEKAPEGEAPPPAVPPETAPSPSLPAPE